MGRYVKVAAEGEVAPGQIRGYEVEGRRIAIYNVEGRYYATQEACTHAEASLAEGELEGETVICPLHFAEFNVRTGEVEGPPAEERLETYEVKAEGGAIYVELP